ncbi:endoglucanase [Pseudomonas duriflava]|uniref:Glucanase n=1 Tax=Pseudomonas duriflava TaxID=459528 RepID=A0A562QHN9_9PSED|nr:glycosyl hydrolase family 8 [Pseudomonas duriflava]TWI55710.1 endoglucanase [Pseudomonas duriflava]
MQVKLLFGLLIAGLPLAEAADVVSCQEGWALYRERFVTPEGRVVDTGNKGISHSEGQGYALLMAEAAGDRKAFDRLWQWTKQTLRRQDQLFSWKYDPQATPAIADRNNATDGDLLIAWALLRAGEQWSDARYTRAAAGIRQSIATHLVVTRKGYTVLLPGLEGFSRDGDTVVNLSYWIFPALQAFARVDPAGPWRTLFNDGQRLLKTAQFGESRLPTDWVTLTVKGHLQPAQGWPPRFGFDAVRIPLYGTWAGIGQNGEWSAIQHFWHSRKDASPPAWVDVYSREAAPYPTSWGVLGIRALVDGQPLPLQRDTLLKEDYYSSSLLMLSQLAQGACTADVS